MAKIQKLSDADLIQSISDGMSCGEIAKKYGISQQAVSKRTRKFRDGKSMAVVADQNIARMLDNDEIRPLEQLKRLNTIAWDMLQRLEKEVEAEDQQRASIVENGEPVEPLEDRTQSKLSIMRELREQLKFYSIVMGEFYSISQQKIFQESILECLEKTSPQLRSDAVRLMNKKRELLGAVFV